MTTTREENEEVRVQDLHVAQRRALNNAYSALLAQQSVQTFQTFTFEEAVDAQIARITEGTELRPGLLDKVKGIEDGVTKAVEEIKKVPPEQFLEKDESRDVNTTA